MSKLGIRLLSFVAIAGVVISLMLRSHATAQQRENEQQLQQQEKQLTELAVENQRLSNLVAEPKNLLSRNNEPMAELRRLRKEAEALRKQTHELEVRREQHDKPPPSASASGQDSLSEEYKQMCHAKAADGVYLATACLQYAQEHEAQVPTNFDVVTNYIQKNHFTLTGTNDFEFVYQGSLTELTNIPSGDVALIRGQAWQKPDGKMVRVYGMANGASQSIPSDDNFQTWEAQHVIPNK